LPTSPGGKGKEKKSTAGGRPKIYNLTKKKRRRRGGRRIRLTLVPVPEEGIGPPKRKNNMVSCKGPWPKKRRKRGSRYVPDDFAETTGGEKLPIQKNKNLDSYSLRKTGNTGPRCQQGLE